MDPARRGGRALNNLDGIFAALGASGDASLHGLYTDAQGRARLQDWDVALTPETPAIDQLSGSAPLAASALLFVRAPAGGGHKQQPEARRQLAIVLSGECEVTASGETRVGRPGDVLLIEDTTGEGHSSHTGPGFTAAMVVLD